MKALRIVTVVFALHVFQNALSNDLLYKSNFEENGLITITANGITNNGLTLLLTSNQISEFITINQNGSYLFESYVNIGQNWLIETTQLPNNPNQQSCRLINNNGILPIGGANQTLINCSDTAWQWDVMNWNEGAWNE
ncbi:hypothetical protein OS175_08970 [Marinicella sp. S1101]|uniref:hypothetical protein n=1 Tax=Marinicella marina TaxID=2996016 RepID=UPI002260FEC6|nr:hypothetical protein [Marinicella marina]MCX7554007.1 hypothetical protein [Marinicella marina]MDJ1140499.1 hypothetical protein [Marinicella marina]